jgi:hypothetical protein
MSSPAPLNAQSSFLPPEIDFPEDNEEFREILSKRNRLLASIVNVKENSNYERRELLSAQQWFSQVVQGYIITQYGFRLTFDLISLNGGPIGPGVTTIAVPTDPTVNTPIVITYTQALFPTHGFGGATIGTTFYFINDPDIYVRYINTSTTVQAVQVTNNTGSNITQFFWCFEYLKK